jgi:tetratricopeptide (TPR) repeat protein
MSSVCLFSVVVAGWLLLAPLASPEPPLPGDFIADLNRLQEQLAAGEAEAVSERAIFQAERLAGGNAADRWSRALYLQLAAGAAVQSNDPAAAADHLRAARETPGVETAQRDRWQLGEARLRLAAGDNEEGVELLIDWLERHEGEPRDRWRLARALAEADRWEAAADWTARALADTPEPSEAQLGLAATVLRRAGREAEALALLADGLGGVGDPGRWREAAALAQRSGDPGQAAAIWEAGWRRGVLKDSEDLRRLVDLHLAGGTPARAAEHLQEALDAGQLEDSEAHRRLLARAWEAARDRDRALGAWERLAERSESGEDWLRLGQLAYAWRRQDLAERALILARERGVDQAEAWLSVLETEPAAESGGDGFHDLTQGH